MKINYGENIRVCDYDIYLDFLDNHEGLNEEELRQAAAYEDFECAFIYYNHFDKVRNKYNQKFNDLQKGKHRSLVVYSLANEVMNDLKEDLAYTMHQYIMSKNGYVDSWPDHIIYKALYTGKKSINDSEKVYFNFVYFGTSITEEYGLGKEFINENHYKTPYKKEYKVFLDQLKKAEDTYKKEKAFHRGSIFDTIKNCIINTPIVVGLIVGVLMLYWTYTNTGSLDDIKLINTLATMFQSENIILKILSAVPLGITMLAAIIWYLASFIGWMFNIEKILMPIEVMVVLGIFYSITEVLDGILGTNIHDSSTIREAKKIIKKINRNPKYKKLKKEYDEYNDRQKELAKIWHEAWFKDYVEYSAKLHSILISEIEKKKKELNNIK